MTALAHPQSRATHPTRFGYTLAVNLGASSPRGTVELGIPEIQHTSEDTYLAMEAHTPPTAKAYTQGIAKVAYEYVQQAKVQQALKALPSSKQTLEHLALFVPGSVTPENQVPILANLRLHDVDLNQVGQHLGEHLKASHPIPVTAANDMVAPALSHVARTLKTPSFQAWLKEHPHRSQRTAIGMTGGGYGVIHTNLHPNPFQKAGITHTFEILPSEQGHLRVNDHEEVLERGGASVHSLIQNYCESLGMNKRHPTTEALVELGNGKVVTQYSLRTSNPKEKQALEATGCFEFTQGETPHETVATLKGVTPEAHLKAQTFAVDMYVDQVARAVQGHALGGLNHFIIGGPLAGGVRETIAKAERPFQKNSLETLLEQALMKHTDSAGFQKMAQQKLKVTYEPFENVLEGASLLSKAVRTKDNSFIIPVAQHT